MHRPALALAAAGRGAEQFVQQLLLAQPLGDGVAVAAEGRGDEVVRPQGGADADRRRLLALTLMDGAGHRAFEEQEAHPLLELADADHPLEQLEPAGGGEGSQAPLPACGERAGVRVTQASSERVA